MKLLSTYKITKGFECWLKMYKEIEPHLNELGINLLWARINASETQVYYIKEVKNPSKFEFLSKHDDITARRSKTGLELHSQEIIAEDYWA